MVFGVYCRKSVLSDKGESVENQINICRSYILSRFGEDNVIIPYEDEGYSGKNTARPMFLKMREAVKNGDLDYVVCYRLDRISRSVSDFSSFVETLNACKTGLICVKEEFDTSRPMGKAMMYIASVFSQLERETIGERVRDNMLMLARDGRWLGGRPPLGYDSVREPYRDGGGRIKTAAYLRQNGDIETVQKIYEYFFKYGSCKKAAEAANSIGLKTSGGRAFTSAAVRDIIANPVYCRADKDAEEYFKRSGKAIYGELADSGLISYNKGSPEGMIIAVGRHKHLLSGAEWAKAQEILNTCDSFALRSLERGSALASGTIICSKCGGRMYAVKRSSGGFDYICKNKRNKAGCGMKNLNGAKADTEISKHIILSGDEYTDRLAVRNSLEILWDGERLEIRKKSDFMQK